MKASKKLFTNFSRAVYSSALCFRPDKESELDAILTKKELKRILARGKGLSYSDCCLSTEGTIIDTSHLNHFISFDRQTGVAVCQPSVTFSDLFYLDEGFIPPIIPGTMHATLAGGVANDVHGKNNESQGTLGNHIQWLELKIKTQVYKCSPLENSELFYATIGGVGLTGFIQRIAIQMRKAPHYVEKTTLKYNHWRELLSAFKQKEEFEYKAAWIDFYSQRSLLFLGNPIENKSNKKNYRFDTFNTPFSLSLLNKKVIQIFNSIFFRLQKNKTITLPLWEFNNPLDKIKNWNRMYGKKGLLQFQCVFNAEEAESIINKLFSIIKECHSTPTLLVLKYFKKAGVGDLAFVRPGFTLAIDFLNNEKARQTIGALNQYIKDIKGSVYLAKDLLLTKEQFRTMYPNYEKFSSLLKRFKSPMRSDLSKRLGLEENDGQ